MKIFQALEFSGALVPLVSERVNLLFVLVGGSFVGPWRVWESSKDSNDGSGDGGDWGVTRWRFMVCVLCVWVVKFVKVVNIAERGPSQHSLWNHQQKPLKNDGWKTSRLLFLGQKKRPIFSKLKPGVFVNTGEVRSMMNCLGDDSCKRFCKSKTPNKQVVARKRYVFAQSEGSSWKFSAQVFIVFFFWLCFLFLILVSIGLCFSSGFVEPSRWLQHLMFYHSCWEISCHNWKASSERGTFFGVNYDFFVEFSPFFSGFWNSHSPFAQLNIDFM